MDEGSRGGIGGCSRDVHIEQLIAERVHGWTRSIVSVGCVWRGSRDDADRWPSQALQSWSPDLSLLELYGTLACIRGEGLVFFLVQ